MTTIRSSGELTGHTRWTVQYISQKEFGESRTFQKHSRLVIGLHPFTGQSDYVAGRSSCIKPLGQTNSPKQHSLCSLELGKLDRPDSNIFTRIRVRFLLLLVCVSNLMMCMDFQHPPMESLQSGHAE